MKILNKDEQIESIISRINTAYDFYLWILDLDLNASWDQGKNTFSFNGSYFIKT